jgi:hypothetical protein
MYFVCVGVSLGVLGTSDTGPGKSTKIHEHTYTVSQNRCRLAWDFLEPATQGLETALQFMNIPTRHPKIDAESIKNQACTAGAFQERSGSEISLRTRLEGDPFNGPFVDMSDKNVVKS